MLDGTLGLGGHAAALLEIIGKNGALIGLDADPRNLALAQKNLAAFPNFRAVHANFRELAAHAAPASLDLVLFDLGVSSPHFDDATRGFSFRAEGSLDMRLDNTCGKTAADLLAELTERELADLFFQFGEIHSSRRLAGALVRARRTSKITTTTQLANLVEATFESRSLLPQVFQALRMAVNDELGALAGGLAAALTALKPGGKLAVISFHSGEDRLVKNFLRQEARGCLCPPVVWPCACGHIPRVKIVTKKAVAPSAAEVDANPRARSAHLRIAEKI